MRAAMSRHIWLLAIVAMGCGGGASGPSCGPGTVLEGGQCVPETAGIDACGPGTALDGATCVPVEADTSIGTDAVDSGPDADVTAVDVPADVTAPTCSPPCTKGLYCDEAGACQVPSVPTTWTCSKGAWADGAKCDCNCGAFDPDCGSGALPVTGCASGKCQDDGTCTACTAQCAGKVCGDDGCGGSCGTCLDPAKPTCSVGQCVACQPNCADRVCGDDGCGGSCGACDTGKLCASGQCIFPPPDQSCIGHCGGIPVSGCSCQGGCAKAGNCCVDVSVCGCQPDCAGKECGDDGCGGQCGICALGATCQNEQCVIGQCDDTTCNSNGVCADNACACNPGFGGKFCTQCAPGFVDFPSCVTGCTDASACNDNQPCTQDDCSTSFGCTHIPVDVTCTDGSACTTGDACVLGACEPTLTTGCDDGNPCTVDACDKAVGCSYLPGAATACDDGNACTSNDGCAAGLCAGTTASNCDDGNSCSDDACDPASGCSHVGNGSNCDNGDLCVTYEACVGLVCTSVASKTCDDGNACTNDSCDGGTGDCVHIAASTTTACDDDDLCTTADACDGNGQCAGGKKVCALSVSAGIVAHFSAAQPSTLAYGSDLRIQGWQDQSSGGHNLSAVDANKTPMLVQNGINGRRGVRMTDGAGLASAAFSYGSQVSLFAVLCTEATPTVGPVASQGDGAGWQLGSSGSAIALTSNGSGSATASNLSGSLCYVVAARAATDTFDVLTVNTLSGDKADAGALTAGSGALVLGAMGSACVLGELLVYDHALSDDERDSVTTYLRTAWGFAEPTPDFAWYDASDLASVVTGTDGSVLQWLDKSGLGRHAMPGSDTPPVWYVNGTSNGQPAVRFDGAGVRLQTAAVPSSAQVTVFAVFEMDNPMAWGSIFNQGQDTYFSLRKDESAANALNWHIQNNNDAPQLPLTLNTWRLVTAVQDGVASLFYADPAALQQVIQPSGIAAGQEILSLGNSFVGNESMGGFLAEIRAYASPLNRTDRAFIEATLKAKYGL
jgi:hypothetical protein